MIVYVESNFILEVVLLQEEHESCERLIEWARAARIQLVIPAYSFVEPYETLRRRHGERARLAQSAREQLKLLRRSRSFATAAPDADSLERLFRESTSLEEERLEEVQANLLGCTTVIALAPGILESAGCARRDFDLSGQDSIVYASVVSHLEQHGSGESCFINRNSKDFDNPSLVEALGAYGCRLLPRFQAGVGYVESRLSGASKGTSGP